MHRHAGPDENDCPGDGERKKVNLQEMDRVDLAAAIDQVDDSVKGEGHEHREPRRLPAMFRDAVGVGHPEGKIYRHPEERRDGGIDGPQSQNQDDGVGCKSYQVHAAC